MTWFKIDDTAPFHVKVVSAGNLAFGAWVRAGAWSSGQQKDGFIPAEIAKLIEPSAKVWARLVAVRLVEPADGGYRIHDFHDYNPTSAEVAAKREAQHEAKRRAGQAGGRRSGEARRNRSTGEAEAKQPASSLLQAEPKQNEAPSRPVPDLTHTQRARDPEPDDPTARELLAAMRSHRALADVATVQAAEWIAGRIMARPRPLTLVVQAIADAARDAEAAELAGNPWGREHAAKMLARYVDNAKPPRDDAPHSGTRPYAAPEPVRTGTRLLTFDDPPRAPRPPKPAPAPADTVPGDALALVAGIGLGGRS